MIEDFIGVFPNAIPDEACDKIIETYAIMEDKSVSRQVDSNIPKTQKDTQSLTLSSYMYDINVNNAVNMFNQSFWNCYKQYVDNYGMLAELAPHQFYPSIKIQKMTPKTGYHMWHCEHGNRITGSRLLLAIGYLNDVEEGGETEFLYQAKRIPARKGTIMICPSGFTHTHRGNPPLSGDKYIINGWIEFTE